MTPKKRGDRPKPNVVDAGSQTAAIHCKQFVLSPVPIRPIFAGSTFFSLLFALQSNIEMFHQQINERTEKNQRKMILRSTLRLSTTIVSILLLLLFFSTGDTNQCPQHQTQPNRSHNNHLQLTEKVLTLNNDNNDNTIATNNVNVDGATTHTIYQKQFDTYFSLDLHSIHPIDQTKSITLNIKCQPVVTFPLGSAQRSCDWKLVNSLQYDSFMSYISWLTREEKLDERLYAQKFAELSSLAQMTRVGDMYRRHTYYVPYVPGQYTDGKLYLIVVMSKRTWEPTKDEDRSLVMLDLTVETEKRDIDEPSEKKSQANLMWIIQFLPLFVIGGVFGTIAITITCCVVALSCCTSSSSSYGCCCCCCCGDRNQKITRYVLIPAQQQPAPTPTVVARPPSANIVVVAPTVRTPILAVNPHVVQYAPQPQPQPQVHHHHQQHQHHQQQHQNYAAASAHYNTTRSPVIHSVDETLPAFNPYYVSARGGSSHQQQ